MTPEQLEEDRLVAIGMQEVHKVIAEQYKARAERAEARLKAIIDIAYASALYWHNHQLLCRYCRVARGHSLDCPIVRARALLAEVQHESPRT